MDLKLIEQFFDDFKLKITNYELKSNGVNYFHFFEYEFEMENYIFIDNIKIKYGENIKSKLLYKLNNY